jgi:NAD(P)-dependent dehydrogenase (short-subunit alcohol dehydrogenase family)
MKMVSDRGMTGVSIVTGAAGGMGSATAARLAAEGKSLILCDFHADRLAETAKTLGDARSIELLDGDISDPRWSERLIALIDHRPIEALIHTAGLSPTMGDIRRMFAVNYDATVWLLNAVRDRMAPGACAVLMSSTAGYLIKSAEIDAALDALEPGQSLDGALAIATDSGRAYSLSKRAVIRLVAREAAAFGARRARIVSIAPGLIDTTMSRAEEKATSQLDKMLLMTPLARYGHADEIATAALFLCSPAASYISGIDIPVDAGLLATMGAL